MPEDLVPILAKDEEKQKAIREKAIADALASTNRTAGPSTGPSTPSSVAASKPQETASKTAAKPAASNDGKPKPKSGMVIQAIPPFDKSRVRKQGAPGPAAGATGNSAAGTPTQQPTAGPSTPVVQAIPASPTAAQAQANSRLNANASVFKPNANAAVFKPVSSTTATVPDKPGRLPIGKITPGPTPSPKQREPAKDVVVGEYLFLHTGSDPFSCL